jgi:hypothetical protein
MKYVTTFALIFLLGSLAYGQEIIEYFIPDSPEHKSTFTSKGIGMMIIETTRQVEHIEGDRYEIITSSKDHFIRNGVQITENEVLWHTHYSSNNLGLTNEHTYNPPVSLVKLPGKKEKLEWSYTLNEVRYDCTAQLDKVVVTRAKRPALRVEQTSNGKTNIVWFVKGIGLWKNEVLNPDGTTSPWLTFEKME